jgi:hypothetical protein
MEEFLNEWLLEKPKDKFDKELHKYTFYDLMEFAEHYHNLQFQQAGVSSRFSNSDMISFGNFIRDNYYGAGAPKLISYNTSKYPHATIEEIFVIWSCENNR